MYCYIMFYVRYDLAEEKEEGDYRVSKELDEHILSRGC